MIYLDELENLIWDEGILLGKEAAYGLTEEEKMELANIQAKIEQLGNDEYERLSEEEKAYLQECEEMVQE